MNLYEFSNRMSQIPKLAIPSYVSELHKLSERVSLQTQPMKNFISVFQRNYPPLKNAFPPSFQTNLQKNNEVFQRMAEGLKSSIPDLSAFQRNYQPLKIGLPTNLYKPFDVLQQMAERLKSSIPDLSAFEYNIEDLTEEEYEESELIEVVDNTKLLLKSIYLENNLLDVVDPREFEEIVAELLHYQGYEVNLTNRTRDGGYDVIALTKIGGIPFKILAECKRHKNTIGIGIIRSFCDVIIREKANKGLIFTTSYFSKPALIRQSEMGTILDLKNRDDLIEWIVQYNER